MSQASSWRNIAVGCLSLAGLILTPVVSAEESYRVGDMPGWELPFREASSDESRACDVYWAGGDSVSGNSLPGQGMKPNRAGISHSPGHPGKPRRQQPGDIDRGDCPPFRYSLDDHDRAGNPHCVAKWASPSIDKRYSAWFVGGGAVWGGRGRKSEEGVWGMDYQGWLPGRRVWLNWTGGRHQGGEGAYQSDGRTGPWSRH